MSIAVTLLLVLLQVPAAESAQQGKISFLKQELFVLVDRNANDDNYSNDNNDVNDVNDVNDGSAEPRSCIRRASNKGNEIPDWDDNGTEDRLQLRASPIQWRGQRVTYRIVNTPVCSGVPESSVKYMIDEAADAWNAVPEANVLLVNIDDTEGNEVADELSRVDIELSFQPCIHPRERNSRRQDGHEFVGCSTTYAHAFKGGDIHFNTLMTWTDETYNYLEIQEGDLLKPNLYSIALHEFGHSLGLSHTELLTQAMNGDFSGNRKYEELELGQDDMAKLQKLYPVEPYCVDKYPQYCKLEDCNEPDKRASCSKTCEDCHECGEDVRDDYLKCTQDICADVGHRMRHYCRKTCRLCDETCTGLLNVDNLASSVVFPVPHGTIVSVTCDPEYQLLGGSVITCQQNLDYSYQTLPTCERVSEPETPSEPEPPCVDPKGTSNCVRTLSKSRKNCKQKKMKRLCPKTCGLCGSNST